MVNNKHFSECLNLGTVFGLACSSAKTVKAAAAIAVSITVAPVALALVAYLVSITVSIIDNTSTAEKDCIYSFINYLPPHIHVYIPAVHYS